MTSVLLDNHGFTRSRSIETVRAGLAQVYARPILQTVGKSKKLNAIINSCQLNNILIGYCAYGAAVSIEFPAVDYFLQMMRLRGEGVVTSGATSFPLLDNCGALISPDRGFKASYDADCARIILQIDAQALTAKLAALTGNPINEPLRMDPRADFTRPVAQTFRDYVQLLATTLSAAEAPLPEWWTAQTEQFLMVMFLFAHRHNYSHLLPQGPPDASLMQVRRVEEYIAANPERPVSLEELAEVSGVSGFSLFRAFKRVHGQSPSAFAARLRSGRKEPH
jgi:hypothetical protein